MQSRPVAGPFRRIPVARTAGTWGGSAPAPTRSLNRGRRAAPTRITGGTRPADNADAAKVVMPGGPASNAEATRLELFERSFIDARLCVDHLWSGVESRTVHSNVCSEAFVEDAGDDTEECGPETRASGGATHERQPVTVEREQRRHHALHPGSRLEPAAQQVGFAQHAVEVQVEAGDEVPG